MTAVALAPARHAPLPVLRRWLVDGWRGLVGWSVGIALVVLVYLPLYPSMKSPELIGLMDSLPPELVRTLGYESITTGSGYAQATFFGLIGFALITMAGISWGAEFTGGAEESGRLELTLAHGVGRLQYALESTVALLVKLLVLGAVAYLVISVINRPSQLELEADKLAAATIAWVGVGLLAATAAFAAGARTGRRSWAIGFGAAVAVTGYGLQAVANNSEDLDWLRAASPFEWAFGQAPLANGWDWPGLAPLWGASVLLIVIGAAALSRRDVVG